MDVFGASERAMGMDDAAWARHANPWSVRTRVPLLPLLALAVFSRVWIGWWALVPLGLVVAWAFLNPRVFPAPARTDRWESRGVLGERVFLNRARVPMPREHRVAGRLLTALSLAGALILAYGLVALAPWPTVCGTALAMLGKLWFVDRMAWLYDVMAPRHPEYAAWMRRGDEP